MPRIYQAVPEMENLIERPVILGIVRDLYTLTGIDPSTKILFPGDMAVAVSSGSTIDNKDDTAIFNQQGKLFITVEERPYEYAPQNSTAFKANQTPLFYDETLGIIMRPDYKHMQVRVSIRYRAMDKNEANRWRTEMMGRLDLQRQVFMHQINYAYPIPDVHWYVLREIHHAMESNHGYGLSFDDYIKSKISNRITLATDIAGKNGLHVVPEVQGRIQGWFDNDFTDPGDRADNTTNWNTSVDYIFTYEKPIAVSLVYPLFVHQRLIPANIAPKFLNEFTKESSRVTEDRTLYGKAIGKFEVGEFRKLNRQNQGYDIPWYDEWIPAAVRNYTIRVFTARCVTDVNDKRALFNVNDVQSVVKLKPNILKFLKGEGKYMTHPYGSVFTLDLYEEFNFVDFRKVTMDENLEIRSTFDMDVRKNYHVRLGVIDSLLLLQPDAVLRLRADPETLFDLISTLYPQIPNPEDRYPTTGEPPYVPKWVWDKIVDDIQSYDPIFRTNDGTGSTPFVPVPLPGDYPGSGPRIDPETNLPIGGGGNGPVTDPLLDPVTSPTELAKRRFNTVQSLTIQV